MTSLYVQLAILAAVVITGLWIVLGLCRCASDADRDMEAELPLAKIYDFPCGCNDDRRPAA